MQPLEKSLRRTLENTVKEARDVAETAARTVIEQYSVGDSAPFGHLSTEERELRRKLRIHGRQIGDIRDLKTEVQTIDRLVEEVAYAHWHKLLFTRFLAENKLLMYPDPKNPVPITLVECDDLVSEHGAKNGWDLAAQFAAQMLPMIFQAESPIYQITLPPEHQRHLIQLVEGLPKEIFEASDSLGWVYQFWQAKKKDEINQSENKIEGNDIYAVTQLFTEPYMVQFILQNTLGAWWLDHHPDSPLKNKWVYYKDQVQHDFSAFPTTTNDLKILDPACGSGHFLIEVFHMLLTMRLEEGQENTQAIKEIVQDNLHGLELDPRCIQIAGFAVALESWKSGFPTNQYLPLPNLACVGLPIRAEKSEWLKLAAGEGLLEEELSKYYDLFKNADSLGSLIQIEDGNSLVSYELLLQKLEIALAKEKTIGDPVAEAFGETASGVLKAVGYLQRKDFHIVITNPPFLGNRKFDSDMIKFLTKKYPVARNNLAMSFLERCSIFSKKGCIYSLVNPQDWIYQKSNINFRTELLLNKRILALIKLGAKAFDSISGHIVQVTLIIFRNQKPNEESQYLALDFSERKTPFEKSQGLIKDNGVKISQFGNLKNPEKMILSTEFDHKNLLSDYAFTGSGLSTYDGPRFVFKFWEIFPVTQIWQFLQSTPEKISYFSGMNYILKWENGTGEIFSLIKEYEKKGYKSGVWKGGVQFWGKKGIIVGLMSKVEVSLYLGNAYGINTSALIPKKSEYLPAIWAYCSSENYQNDIREIDTSLKIPYSAIAKVPFDLLYWQKIASNMDPIPKPQSDDPTQWIFHGHPAKSDSPLQVAVARLLCFRWPAELDPEMELSDEQKAWVKKCDALLSFADDDGIVCIPSIRGEPSATDRLLSLLATAYEGKMSNDVLSQLLADADHEGKTLETWLRDKFFIQHCKLFQNRPFIWQIWDGLRDGFSVLVNYHMLDHKTLETLIYSYLGDWINRQKHDIEQGIDGAQEKLDAAETLKKRLDLIWQGEAPYDIFVRWKPLDQQPNGWNPDLNDGVRLNIRPFMSVPDIGKRGAGVLRDKLNIKLDKDRGGDVESAPWYHLFKGDRINDHHLTIAEKTAARESHKKESGS